jgi:transcriptional regulator with XRE-family HTH domain
LSGPIQTIFGKVLRKYRLQHKLSQEDLAELADLDRTYISQLERGLKSPSIQTLFSLSQALQVKPHILLSEIEKELYNYEEQGGDETIEDHGERTAN